MKNFRSSRDFEFIEARLLMQAEIGDLLKTKRRYEKRLTVKKLIKEAGLDVTRQYISQMESGKSFPSFYVLKALFKYYDDQVFKITACNILANYHARLLELLKL